jgi:hypothetical protein
MNEINYDFEKYGIGVDPATNAHVNELYQEAEEMNVGLSERLKSLQISTTDELRPPEIAWVQDLDGQESILGTLGNFSLVIGKAKSRKSFFICIALSVVLCVGKLLKMFKGKLPSNKTKAIYFDTEQSKYHVQLALKRICKLIGIEAPTNLEVYGLRSRTPAERLELIEYAIYNTENLGFVVIDGIKDLVTSINDEGEATMIASKLLKWTEEKGIHIVTVLHQNKSDNNARGHIGTELINKAETVLTVSKNEQDKDISIVEAAFCRDREPEPFAFEIIDGLPSIVENFAIRTAATKNKVDVTHLSEIEHYELLQSVYRNGSEFGYSELVRQLKIAFKSKFDKPIGDNRTKDLLSYCKNKKWLLQEKPQAPYKLGKIDEGLEKWVE